jgi:hypothetical protein
MIILILFVFLNFEIENKKPEFEIFLNKNNFKTVLINLRKAGCMNKDKFNYNIIISQSESNLENFNKIVHKLNESLVGLRANKICF